MDSDEFLRRTAFGKNHFWWGIPYSFYDYVIYTPQTIVVN